MSDEVEKQEIEALETPEIVPVEEPPPEEPTAIAEPLPLPRPPVKPPPPKKKKSRAKGCLWVFLAVVVIVFLVIPALHLFLLRPLIQTTILDFALEQAAEFTNMDTYTRGLANQIMEEDDLEDTLDDIWGEIVVVDSGWVRFEQDRLSVGVKIFGIGVEASADASADESGDIILQDVKLDWPLRILFQTDYFATRVQDFINKQVLAEGNMAMRAIQFTDGQLLIVYEARD